MSSPPLPKPGTILELHSLSIEKYNGQMVAFCSVKADDDQKWVVKMIENEKPLAVLPERTIAEADKWKFAVYPFADAARGAAHMSTLRAAIRARQKLRLTYHSKGDRITTRTVRPLHMEYWGRVWTMTCWCELRQDFRVFRVDLIHQADALPEMFVDEPGKRLADYDPNL